MNLIATFFLMTASINLSHEKQDESFQNRLTHLTDMIHQRKDLPYATVDQQIEILNQLANSEFGKFLIERGGLNGYWTHYVVAAYPSLHNKPQMNWVEEFLLEKAPTCLATQQRFQIFKKELQKRVSEGTSFASVPCGLMGDLIGLDFSKILHFTLTGIDIDAEAIDQGQQLAKECGLSGYCKFLQRDAWDLNITDEFDVLTSNGLSIYEPDDTRVLELYQEFFKASKPGGHLITSFLTPLSEWDFSKIDRSDALMQKVIFSDILSCKWQVFRSREQVKNLLTAAGFIEIEFIEDEASIFPTVVARKPK